MNSMSGIDFVDSIVIRRTVEKGTLNGKTYDEKIGIRIEDNLVMTSDGCMNLSSKIPKTIKQIEKLMASRKEG